MRLTVAAALADAQESEVERFLAATRRMGLGPEDEVVLAVTLRQPLRGAGVPLLLAARERVLRFDAPLSLTALWGKAMAAAQGAHVAVLDGRDEPTPGWVSAWVAAPSDHIVCGPVNPHALGALTSWAAYLSEYGQFYAPLDRGGLPELPGNNVVFPRALLPPPEELEVYGFWKTFHLERLKRERELAIAVANEMMVSFRREYLLGPYLKRRFIHGRCYGGRRTSEPGTRGRFTYLAMTPALPAVRTVRVLRRILTKPALLRRFGAAFVPVVLGEVAWAVGEGVGYAAGEAGACDALR